LAAFFLADFLVGFFLAVFRVTVEPADLRFADVAFPPFFAVALAPLFRADLAVVERVGRFLLALPAFGLALLRPAFFVFGMPSPVCPDRLVKRGLDLTHNIPVEGIGIERKIAFPRDRIRNGIYCGALKFFFVG